MLSPSFLLTHITMLSKIFQAMLLAGMAYAAAIPTISNLKPRAADAASQILQIAPTSNTCSGAPIAGECATNTQAGPFLISAMAKYSIYNPNEIAAVLSVIAFETADFKYNTNHFPAPGRPGQGTRSMMMPNNVMKYAQSIEELSADLKKVTTAADTTGLSDDTLNAVRALVLPDEYSWGSAAWYLTTQCGAGVRTALQAGGQAGFDAYMGCLGVTATPDRLAYWTRATASFGL